MSSLTAEQRKRMEENRKKALEKLSLLKAASGRSTGSGPLGSNSSNFVNPLSKANNQVSTNANSQSSLGNNRNPPAVNSSSHSSHSSGVSKSLNNNDGSKGVFKSSSESVNWLPKGNSEPSPGPLEKVAQAPISGVLQKVVSGGTQPTAGNTNVQSSVPSSGSPSKFISLEAAQRMEENRRKALEKRAAASTHKSTSIGNNSSEMNKTAGSLLNKNPVTNFYKSESSATSKTQGSTVSSNPSGSFSASSYKQNPKNISNPNFSGQGKKDFSLFQDQSTSKMSDEEKMVNSVLNEFDDEPKPVFGKAITGQFCLISRERFVVDVSYHKQMIEIFKTMPSRKYDVETRKWNFSLSDHDALIEALKPLRPAVCIGPLPPFVRKTLRTVANQMPATCVDLFGLDPKLVEALMPFQHDGVCFGIQHRGRVMIADDMGLGKTIQALGIAAYYRSEWPLLIVSPSSVRYSWKSSIERWLTSVEGHDIAVINSGKDHIDDVQIVITSYDLLSRRRQEFLNRNFKVVIMDESHMLKSFKTARYKAAAPIMKKCNRLILLSGTPALSRPSELYTQISGINPDIFPRFQDYGVRYCDGRQLPWGWDFSGSSNMEELQIILQSSVMIRRMKSEVLSQLPSKQRMMVMLDPSLIKTNTRAMEEASKHLGLKTLKGVERHGALLEFFAQSAIAKLKAVSEYVKELLEGESKIIVFAHHRIMLDKLCETCDSIKVQYIRIDGRTSGDTRQHLVNKFQNSDNVKVAVLSITAANAGITLTAAQLVVFAEIFWNPGVLVQAEDRAHRIGQQDSVTVQYLMAKGTADDYIWPLVQSKIEVLSKAGLSKDTTLSGDATYQKNKEQGTIEKYLEELGESTEIPDDPTDDGEKVETKKERKGGIQQYFSNERSKKKNDDDDDDEPQSKMSKLT